MGRDSSIATNPPVREIIDAALLAGESPHAIAERLGETLGVSRSSVYRYARSDYGPLISPVWLDPSTRLSDAVRDLGEVRRDLVRRYDAAVSNADATRLSRELRELTSTLKREHDETDPVGEPPSLAEMYDETAQTLGQLLWDRPVLIPVARDIATRKGFKHIPAELDALAERRTKEN